MASTKSVDALAAAAPQRPAGAAGKGAPAWVGWLALAALAALAIAALTAGAIVERQQEQRSREALRIEAMAKLRAEQVEHWLGDRLAPGRLIASGEATLTASRADPDAPAEARLEVMAPLQPSGKSAPAAVVLHADPDTTLLPMLRAWPYPSATGGTPLVRRDGDQVVGVRGAKPVPLSKPNLLAVTIAAFRSRDRAAFQAALLAQTQQRGRLQELELLDAIIKSSTDIIFAKDLAGRYLWRNRAAPKRRWRPASCACRWP